MPGNVPLITETRQTRIVQAVRDLFAGRSNATGEVTLTASAASTTVSAPNCGAGSHPVLQAATANAAAEVAAGGMYVSAVAGGSFTITHANNAQDDRTFYWMALG